MVSAYSRRYFFILQTDKRYRSLNSKPFLAVCE
uniref:Uncharacterized protein n=1 Tax=Siphoviridae sp. ctOow3 TaxID=2826315 RepID=A0A8S5R0H9_9CAUD|nr:MAG TPA: hypothetical protein [Siphoviridae sp. ctOow3]